MSHDKLRILFDKRDDRLRVAIGPHLVEFGFGSLIIYKDGYFRGGVDYSDKDEMVVRFPGDANTIRAVSFEINDCDEPEVVIPRAIDEGKPDVDAEGDVIRGGSDNG